MSAQPKSPAPSSGAPRAGGGRKWLKRIGFGVALLVLLVLFAVVGLMSYLSTDAGGRRVRETAVKTINESIQGSLEAKQVEFIGGDTLILHDVVLKDPEGNVVAEIARLEAKLKLPALALKRIHVELFKLDKPRFYLVQDDRGLNLSRAIKSKKESLTPEEDDGAAKALKFSLVLGKFELNEGHVDFRQHGEAEDRRVTLDAIEMDGNASLSSAGNIGLTLGLGGQLQRPLEGPVKLQVNAKTTEDTRDGDVSFDLAGLGLDAKLTTEGKDAKLVVERLVLDPKIAKAFLPTYPLIVPIQGTGTLDYEDEHLVEATLSLTAATAKAELNAKFDTRTMKSPGFELSASSVNLQELMEDMPSSNLALTLKGEGGGESLETADGKVVLDVPVSTIKGQKLGPIHAEASAREGRFQLAQAIAELPGAKLSASGSGSQEQVDLSAHLSATDLKLLARTFGSLSPSGKAPALTGRGSMDLNVRGRTKSPGVSAVGNFAELGFGDTVARELAFDANIPDITVPLQADAHLTARSIRAGERVFNAVNFELETQQREFHADLSAKSLGDLSFHTRGLLDEDRLGLLLREMEIAYPEAKWALVAPSQVRFDETTVRVEKLELKSDPQRLMLSLLKEGKQLQATVELDAFDLHKLPRAFVDPQLGLAGRVDARITTRGPISRPNASAKVTLVEGRFKHFVDLGLELDATYVNDRARGTLDATSRVATAKLEFDAPVQGLMRRRPEPLTLTLTVPEVSVADAMAAAGSAHAKVTGTAGGKIEITGTAEDPRLRALISSRDIRIDNQPPPPLDAPSFDLLMESEPTDSTLSMRLDAKVDVLSTKAFVKLSTPYTLAKLLQAPPTKEQALKTPIALEAHIQDFPIERLPAQAATQVKGSITLNADFKGPPLEPKGTARLILSDVTTASVPPTTATLDFGAEEEGLNAKLRVNRQETELANLTATFGAPLKKLRELSSIIKVPLTVEGTVGPVPLAELTGATKTPEELAAKPVQGLLRAEVKIEGNLTDPKAHLEAYLEQFGIGPNCMGKARMAVNYANQKGTLDVALVSAGGGTLDLDAQTQLDLSYQGTQKGLDLSRAPLRASLRARKFDLAFLSGITPTIRTLGGRLEATVDVEGKLTNPRAKADVEWAEGRVAMEGYGEYRNIHLALHADNERIQLSELKAESSGGSMRVTLDGVRSGKRFDLKGTADLEKFPFIKDDQLIAFMSMRTTLEGSASDERINIRELRIPEAHIFLPESKRKDLQDLDRPDDVVLVKNGKPLIKRKQKKPETGTGGASAPAAEEHDLTPESPPREYWATIIAPRNLWVHGPDVNVEVGLSDGFKFEYANKAVMYGSVQIIRGRADVLGREFEIEKNSQLRFTGPVKEPYINVTAIHKNEREDVTVQIAARGQGTDLTLKPSSEPPLTDSEIYTLLATGRRTLKRGSGSTSSGSAQAASIMGSVVASQMKKFISAAIPLDVITVEAGDEGLSGARVEAGKYLSDRVYFGISYKHGADPLKKENHVTGKVEFQMTKAWSFELETGDVGTTGADVVWTRDY